MSKHMGFGFSARRALISGAIGVGAMFAFPAWAVACDDIAGTVRDLGSYAAVDVETTLAFYDSRGGGCAWDDDSGAALLSVVQAAGDHGLDPRLFHADILTGKPKIDTAARDALMTDGALKFAAAMLRGLSGPPVAKVDRAAGSPKNGEIIDGLSQALEAGNVAAWLDGLAPRTDSYLQIRAALATYRSMAEAGGWELMPTELLSKKKRAAFIPMLRQRLAIEGDLLSDSGSDQLDEDLHAALERFQSRNGMRADGKINAKTIDRLNVSASQRVVQLAVNLERLRIERRNPSDTRIEVNAPAQTAVLYRDGIPHMTMNVVVGKPGHNTPTLASRIDTIVLNPSWTIPQSIIRNEIKPALKRNKDYLVKHRMYWAGDQLVQEPGPHNALGRVKFDFPNRYSVYLHDTPSRKAFMDAERAQSHGCVRLERPVDLAAELLRDDPNWTREAIEQTIRDGATRRVPLTTPMPVIIVYETAFVGDDGLVQFRPDIYGLDTQLTLALSQRASVMQSKATPAAKETSAGEF
jgi:murein L,D-transpeptidase YcbB/YkuD